MGESATVHSIQFTNRSDERALALVRLDLPAPRARNRSGSSAILPPVTLAIVAVRPAARFA